MKALKTFMECLKKEVAQFTFVDWTIVLIIAFFLLIGAFSFLTCQEKKISRQHDLESRD